MPTALRPVRRCRLQVEELEARRVLSGYQPTAAEELFLVELNAARADPAAYGASIGVDLSGVAPAPPLAMNQVLAKTAHVHSQDMNAHGYFAHTTLNGINPGQRLARAGFAWTTWHESIAGGESYATPADALEALIIDTGIPNLDHRRHLLAMDPVFQGQRQVGIGVVQNGAGPLDNYYTIDSASTTDPRSFLTGVIYNDANGNGRYDLGEGLAGVTITVSGPQRASITDFNSGGYSLQLEPGVYTVTAHGGALGRSITRTVTIGSVNVELDFSPRDDAFIQHVYRTELGRSATSAELPYWENVVHTQGTGAVAEGIAHSPEARMHLVKGWYKTYLGRTASNAEAAIWANAMMAGASEEETLDNILSSAEFYNRAQRLVRSGTPDQRYLEALYSVLLHRTASSQDLTAWAGAMPSLGRAGVALEFIDSFEYRADAVAADYVNLLHRRRPPTAAEVAPWAQSPLNLTEIRVEIEGSMEAFLKS
jgi:uncharacterized protein YkwD